MIEPVTPAPKPVRIFADFGTSRIKCAFWDVEQAVVLTMSDKPTPQPATDASGRYETPAEDYWVVLEGAVRAFQAAFPGHVIRELWLCTEMHGFMLADPGGEPLTGYISWRDQRAATDYTPSQESTLAKLGRSHASKFQRVTGMKLKAGLPFVTLKHLARHRDLSRECRILTLADWILLRGGCHDFKSNPTLAAGTGLYDISEGRWSPSLAEACGLDPATVIWAGVEEEPTNPLGVIDLAGRSVGVYGGFGDLQTALAGMGFGPDRQTAINLGTGSQVAVHGPRQSAQASEIRLGIDGSPFVAITHIPCGRAIAVFANLLDNCARQGGGRPFFWDLWDDLTVDELLATSLRVDLNLFDGAWKYSEASGGLYLREGAISPRLLVAGIAGNWLRQYVEAIDVAAGGRSPTPIVISGGMSRRGRFVQPALEALAGQAVNLFQSLSGEETLDGLIAVSRLPR